MMLPIFATSLRRFLVICVPLLALACEIDSVTSLVYDGTRYTGVVIPGLRIEATDIKDLGLPDRSDLGTDRPVLSLVGVDPGQVIVVRGQPDEETPWTLFLRDDLIGGRNLFDIVPAMCRYAPPTQSECP